MPKIGDKEFIVSWIDESAAIALAKKRGADPDKDGLWDTVEMCECEAYRTFPSKGLAIAFAKRNRKLDMYEMPRVEQIEYRRMFDDLGEDCGYSDWDRVTGWDIDGAGVHELPA